MKTKLITAFAALALSTSMASAKSVDGIGSGGLKSETYSRVVANMTKAKLCKNIDLDAVYDEMRADAHVVSSDHGIGVAEVMVLANKRSNRIMSTARKEAQFPALTNKVCGSDAASLSRFGSFAHTRIPIDIKARTDAKLAALENRDKAVDIIVLRASASHCDFDDHEKHISMMERASMEGEISKSAFDYGFLTSSAWSRDDVNAAFKEKFGDSTECEAGRHLVAKYGVDYERDED